MLKHKGKPLTGEILTLDEALSELYDLTYEGKHEVVYIVPFDAEDTIYTVIRYDMDEYDDFIDVFGGVILRDSWVQDYREWVVCTI